MLLAVEPAGHLPPLVQEGAFRDEPMTTTLNMLEGEGNSALAPWTGGLRFGPNDPRIAIDLLTHVSSRSPS